MTKVWDKIIFPIYVFMIMVQCVWDKFLFQIYGTTMMTQVWDKFLFPIYGTTVMTKVWDKIIFPIHGTSIMTHVWDIFVIPMSQWNIFIPNLSQACNVTWECDANPCYEDNHVRYSEQCLINLHPSPLHTPGGTL